MATTPHDLDFERSLDEPEHPGRLLTEEEFVEWCVDSTWAEWVDGEVIMMTPVSIEHYDRFEFLYLVIAMFVARRRLGRVFAEPVQIRLRDGCRRSPDIFFVSSRRRSIIKRTYIQGAPDLVVEIVSPSSENRDWRDKHLDYEKAGVLEYWVVDPAATRLVVYRLGADGKYAAVPETEGRVVSRVIPGFYVRPEWLWQEPLPSVDGVLAELEAAATDD